MNGILVLIPEGKENAVSNKELQKILNLPRREVSRLIHEARLNGAVICSNNHGYYAPANDQELIDGYDTLWKKSVHGLASQKAMRAEIVRRGLKALTYEAQVREYQKQQRGQ